MIPIVLYMHYTNH